MTAAAPPLRVLHVCNLSWVLSARKGDAYLGRYYTTDRALSNGLVRNGCNVWDFSYRDIARQMAPMHLGKALGAKRMNDYLVRQARAYQPDLLLLGHCDLIAPQTLAILRDALPQCKIAQWWVDWFEADSFAHLELKLPFLDVFLATTAPSYYRQKFAGVRQMPRTCYMPNVVDSAVHTEASCLAGEHQYDLLFAGTDAGARAALLARLRGVLAGRLRCGFFGFGGNPALGGREFIRMIGRSKMGLNLSRATDIPMYTSDRMVQLAANGALVLTPRTPQMQRLFGEDEVAYYGSEEDLLALVERHSKDDAGWRKVAAAGRHRAHSCYNEQRVARFITEAAWGDFSERYGWEEDGG